MIKITVDKLNDLLCCEKSIDVFTKRFPEGITLPDPENWRDFRRAMEKALNWKEFIHGYEYEKEEMLEYYVNYFREHVSASLSRMIKPDKMSPLVPAPPAVYRLQKTKGLPKHFFQSTVFGSAKNADQIEFSMEFCFAFFLFITESVIEEVFFKNTYLEGSTFKKCNISRFYLINSEVKHFSAKNVALEHFIMWQSHAKDIHLKSDTMEIEQSFISGKLKSNNGILIINSILDNVHLSSPLVKLVGCSGHYTKTSKTKIEIVEQKLPCEIQKPKQQTGKE